jgi:hypothetical protein
MGVPRFWTGTLAGALSAPLFILAACGSGDDSVADPPVSPSATSSSTGTPQRETPEAFIRHFVSISNAMEMRGSTKEYLALTSGCKPCRSLATQIDSARREGGFYRSRGWSIESMQSRVPRNVGRVDIAVKSAPTSFKTSADASVQHYSGGDFTFRIAIRRNGSTWEVTNVAQVAA